MIEIEKMKRAKMYLDKMAMGIDPITDSPIPEGDILHNLRIARCFMYVSTVLENVIRNGGVINKGGKIPFSISREELEHFPYSKQPLMISQVVSRINYLRNNKNGMKQLTAHTITSYLLEKGILEEFEDQNGKKQKRASSLGESMGVSSVSRNGMYGGYFVLLYDEEMQHFIIENMNNILSKTRLAKNESD